MKTAWLCIVALFVCACSKDVIPQTEVVVQIESELSIGKQLARLHVAIVELSGGDEIDGHDYVLSNKKQAGKVSFPFSFTVTKRNADRFRLHVFGYAPKTEAGAERLVIESKVIVSFRARQTLVHTITLASACYDLAEPCTGDQTCYPFGSKELQPGACGDIPEETRLPPFPGPDYVRPEAGPPAELDGGTEDASTDGDVPATDAGSQSLVPEAGPSCGARDGTCPEGCTAADPDCITPGTDCKSQADCGTDLFCVDGVCCNTSCEDMCHACNLTDSPGTCSPMDLTADPKNCGECGTICPYGLCEDNSCKSTFYGFANPNTVYQLEAKKVFLLPLPAIQPGKLAAIGILTRASPTAKVRLALFEDQFGDVGNLVYEGEPVPVVESVFPAAGHARGSEVLLDEPLEIVQQGDYWVMVLFSSTAQVYSQENFADAWYSEGEFAFDASLSTLPALTPVDAFEESVRWLNVYSVLTP